MVYTFVIPTYHLWAEWRITRGRVQGQPRQHSKSLLSNTKLNPNTHFNGHFMWAFFDYFFTA